MGWEYRFFEGSETWPGLTVDAAKYLVTKGVKGVGVDVAVVDTCTDQENQVHQTFLPEGIVIYENLRNLKELPPFVYFIALPLMLEGGTGMPVRAVALI